MQPHEQRVVDEKQALSEKMIALVQFINASPIFAGLNAKDRELLRQQRDAMMDYHQVLEARIERFASPD